MDGETPWGQNYAVAAIKENITVNGAQKEVARAVVYETGASLLSRLKRAGYEDTAEAKLGLKRTVAMKAVSTQKLLAGFVSAGSFTSTGSMSSFTKDLTPWLVTAPTEAIAVVLIGFPDLEPANDGGGGGPGSPMGDYSFCEVALGNRFGQNGTCGAPTVMLKDWPSCSTSGFIVPVPEIGSTLTFGTQHTSLGPAIVEEDIRTCEQRCATTSWPDVCRGQCTTLANQLNSNPPGDEYILYGQASLNNQSVATAICEHRTCGAASTPGQYNCSTQRIPWGTRDALCCTPR